MSQVTLTRDTLKAMYNADQNGDVQSLILNAVPDLLNKDGFVLNDISTGAVADFVESLDVSKYNDTDLIEVVNRTASGDEAGKGFYLHRQGGDVTWYAAPTKKGKAVRLVPVYTGTEAEQHLIDLGYTAL
jgi:hypothetical protein